MPSGQKAQGNQHTGASVTWPLDIPTQSLKGIGARLAATLAKIGIFTVGDILRHFPTRWEDRTQFRTVSEVQNGEIVSLKGVVSSVTVKRPRAQMSVTEVVLNDNGSALRLIWFNQPFLERSFKPLVQARKSVVVFGQVKRSGWTPEILNPEWEEHTDDRDSLSANRIVPVYPATEGLRQTRLRTLVESALELYSARIIDCLPSHLLQAHQLVGLEAAYRSIHFPESFADLDSARRRLIFDEFFLFQASLALRRHSETKSQIANPVTVDRERLKRDLETIVPFQLTGAQRRAIGEIAADFTGERYMNRLLQGDVGSGKTVVAMAAMLMAMQGGRQSALMAPTEILAHQHAIVLKKMLGSTGIVVDLATGNLPAKIRREVRARIESGETNIAIGTHALIQEDVVFHNLGLVVVDEQHRFGVLQRQALVNKGERPHVLVMTATPIPRTVTLTLYGDLDVSVLGELPPGRIPVKTHWKGPEKRNSVYRAAEQLLQAGRQIYIVCSLVEESEKLQAASATALAQEMATDVFPDYKVGLLHGQMKSEDKDRVMAQFKAHELDVLVSTTVIEVGIDVPNASAIIIEDADRFGLAQLHQLRGRVGRGAHASYCVMIGSPKTEIGIARMEIMTRTSDGFIIAEEDLKLRGPGEFFGTRQSGLPEFAIADVVRDHEILMEARTAAFQLVTQDPALASKDNSLLRQHLACMATRPAEQ